MYFNKGIKFKVKNNEYIVTDLVFQNKHRYVYFKTLSWDEEVKYYQMEHTQLESKVKIENFNIK